MASFQGEGPQGRPKVAHLAAFNTQEAARKAKAAAKREAERREAGMSEEYMREQFNRPHSDSVGWKPCPKWCACRRRRLPPQRSSQRAAHRLERAA